MSIKTSEGRGLKAGAVSEVAMGNTGRTESEAPRNEHVSSVDRYLAEGVLGNTPIFFCGNYAYTGKVVSYDDDEVLLTDASVVYETGAFDAKELKYAESLPNDLYLARAKIETVTVLTAGEGAALKAKSKKK